MLHVIKKCCSKAQTWLARDCDHDDCKVSPKDLIAKKLIAWNFTDFIELSV